MTEYIKRADALKIVARNCVNGEITLKRYGKIIDDIYDIPSADVAPVRHGRWIITATDFKEYANCSLCNAQIYSEDAGRYCPNCGAQMAGR